MDKSSNTGTRWLTIALAAALLLYAGAAIYYLAIDRTAQWDFGVYYYAGRAVVTGQDPYNQQTANTLAAQDGNPNPPTALLFNYTPITLPLFTAFSLFSYATAVKLWLLFKCLLVAGLLVVWRRVFLPGTSWLLLGLFGLLAFGATLYIGLLSGNVAIIEQFLLWCALACLLRRRFVLFVALVMLAATFKVVPIVFLALLLFFMPAKKALPLLAGALAVFALVVWASFALVPTSWAGFFGNVVQATTAFHERGYVNPSALALANDLVNLVAHDAGLVAPTWLSFLAYGLFAALVLVLTLAALRPLNLSSVTRRPELELLTIFIFCAAYTLISPRLKNYSYTVLIPPALYLAQSLKTRSALLPLLFILLVQPATAHNLFKMAGPIGLFWDYYLLFLAAGTWAAGLLVLRDLRAPPANVLPSGG